MRNIVSLAIFCTLSFGIVHWRVKVTCDADPSDPGCSWLICCSLMLILHCAVFIVAQTIWYLQKLGSDQISVWMQKYSLLDGSLGNHHVQVQYWKKEQNKRQKTRPVLSLVAVGVISGFLFASRETDFPFFPFLSSSFRWRSGRRLAVSDAPMRSLKYIYVPA